MEGGFSGLGASDKNGTQHARNIDQRSASRGNAVALHLNQRPAGWRVLAGPRAAGGPIISQPLRLSHFKDARNPTMNTEDPTSQRLTELEIKASFTEDLLDQLNLVIVRQQGQIDALLHELRQLR
jgi:hypothetical protein